MYSYSPIKSIIIQNFRNIGEATLDFTESPIITLIGDNESGKTSVVKAFGVCAKNIDSRSQKDFIRDGTNEFGVAIILEDGTTIVRKKGKGTNANRYWVVYPDGTRWEADKFDTETPPQIQDLMGLIEEPETKELIHIRTYEDQLLFVVTPASTNYKVMYDALKISQITRAIKVGNGEANALKSEINRTETSIYTLNKSLSNIKTYDLEPLTNIKNKLIKDQGIIQKINKILELKNKIESNKAELGAIDLIDKNNLGQIDLMTVDKFNRVGSLIINIEQEKIKSSAYLKLSEIKPIDAALVQKLNNTVEKLNNLNNMKIKSNSYIKLSELDVIPEGIIKELDRAIELAKDRANKENISKIYDKILSTEPINYDITKFDNAFKMITQIKETENWLSQANGIIEKIINWFKQIGVTTANCPKCGESIVIDIDTISN